MPDSPTVLVAHARRDLNNLASFLRRKNLTGWVSRNARPQYQAAFRAVCAVEDALGVEHPTSMVLGDRLLTLYYEARRRHLLDNSDVLQAERDALADLDRLVAH